MLLKWGKELTVVTKREMYVMKSDQKGYYERRCAKLFCVSNTQQTVRDAFLSSSNNTFVHV